MNQQTTSKDQENQFDRFRWARNYYELEDSHCEYQRNYYNFGLEDFQVHDDLLQDLQHSSPPIQNKSHVQQITNKQEQIEETMIELPPDISLKLKFKKIRTDNTSQKPIWTCLKNILFRLDDKFSGFFPTFVRKNSNYVRKQVYQWVISFAQFNKISLNGSQSTLKDIFHKFKHQFTQLVEEIKIKSEQRAQQASDFIERFYEALECQNYLQRFSILYENRKQKKALKSIEQKRVEFQLFSEKKK